MPLSLDLDHLKSKQAIASRVMQQIDNLYSSDELHPQHLLGASVVATYIY